MDIDKTTHELLVGYIAGNLNDPEMIQIRNWIDESSEHREYFNDFKKYYQLTRLVKKDGTFSLEEGWERVKEGYRRIYLTKTEDIKTAKRLLIRKYMIPVAASIMFAFFIGALSHQFFTLNKVDHTSVLCEINVPYGSKSQVRLPDSTLVWLNAGSKLSYYNNTFMKNRVVMLEGEAYFNVIRRANNHFVVKTSGIDIKVYGTQFNVKSYPEESEITTALIKGKVALEWNGSFGNERVFLEPNQIARLSKTKFQTETSPGLSGTVQIENNSDIQKLASWKDNEWVIDGKELDELAVLLERRYNVKIEFADESLKYYKFSGTLKEESLEQVLKIIQISAPILFTITDNKVSIYEDPSFRKRYDSMISNPD